MRVDQIGLQLYTVRDLLATDPLVEISASYDHLASIAIPASR